MEPIKLRFETWLLSRRLVSGLSTLSPVADLSKVAYGPEGQCLSDQQLFLSEHLATLTPEDLARFAFPEGVTLTEVKVLLAREELPRRYRVKSPVTVPCVVIPEGNDRWVLAVPIDHVLYVRKGEDLAERVSHEVQRLVAANETSPWDWLQLLPARGTTLVKVPVEVERSDRLPGDKAQNLRKLVRDRERKRWAIEVLGSVARPLHVDLPRKIPAVVGRDPQLRQLAGLLDGKQRLCVLLQGPTLAGKSALVRQWLRTRMDRDPDAKVYATSGAQLIAGMSGLGEWEERLRRVMEAAEVLDAVLWFDNLGDLFTDRSTGMVDFPSALKPWLEDGKVRVVGELRSELVDLAERQAPGFLSCFSRLGVEAMDAKAATEALRSRVDFERAHRKDLARLRDDAVATVIDLAERYLPYQSFPGKALKLYEDLRSIEDTGGFGGGGARNRAEGRSEATPRSNDEPRLITPDEVHDGFSLQSGIPSFLLRERSALALDEVVGRIQARVIGQREAVRRVAEVVCVVKARMQPTGRPLATLLFVGPTGVGKTELARGLAELLFGSDERLLRFDMSEFTDIEAADRLLRGTRGAEGLLTRRIREQPFAAVLLDEIEKAHPSVFDLLLQVLGEARLTDGKGRTAYFHNAIVIMTSNLGAAGYRETVGFSPSEDDPAKYYTREVERSFRPEFVNRLDRVVAFSPLSRDEVRSVARIAVAKVSARRGVTETGATLTVTDAALEHLVGGGYSARYGARALRRHVEEALVAPVARRLSACGDRAKELALVQVSLAAEDTPEAPPSLGATVTDTTEADGLRVTLHFAKRGDAARALRSVERLMHGRREVDASMTLPRIVGLRERIEYLVAQLEYGKGPAGAAAEDRRGAAEIAELQQEHHALDAVWTVLDAACSEVHALEALGLQTLMDRGDAESLMEDLDKALARFRRALTYALLVDVKRRDQVTLRLMELEGHFGFERWLLPLIAEAPRRGWTVKVHVDGMRPERGEEWPADRRWGPPREPTVVSELLEDVEKAPRALLVRVEGPWAGALLATEQGVHHWPGSEGRQGKLDVSLLGMRTGLTDPMWKHQAAQPLAHAPQEERRRAPAARTRRDGDDTVTVEGRRKIELDEGEYFPRIEEVAMAGLLRWEISDEVGDRDALFEGPLDLAFR